MAIYHLSVKIISRSHGKSAVAAAAYRSASELHDKRQNLIFDYSRKVGVAYSEILAPTLAPEWIFDRERLWNEAEAAEKRINSQVAREIEIAIPVELSKEQSIALVKEFVTKQFVAKGMVADINIHLNDLENPHAHILLTTREISREGFGKKNRAWNAKEQVLEWRQTWAEVANEHLREAGYEIVIDHRSYKAQGLEIEPTVHLGPKINYSPHRDYALRQEYDAIVKRNYEKIVRSPKIALDILTKQQAVFNEIDIAKFAHRNSATAEQYTEVLEAIKHCPTLIELAKTEHGRTIYTTREMVELELKLVDAALSLNRRDSHDVAMRHKQQALHGTWLENLLGKEKIQLGEGQLAGLEHLLSKEGLKVVVGYAGTGKSTLMSVAKDAWEAQGYRVLGTALSGIAAQKLEELGIGSRTIDSLLLSIDKESIELSANDVLVIDEAGMVDSRRMLELLLVAELAEAKVVLIGDPEQLQPIQAGAPFRAIAHRVGYAEITEIVRQYDHLSQERTQEMREASKEFATLKTTYALDRYRKMESIYQHATREESIDAVIDSWYKDKSQGISQIMLAYTRRDVATLNHKAREMLRDLLQQEKVVLVRNRDDEEQELSLAVNDRVYFIKNDRHLGVKNGTLGTVLKIKDRSLTVALDSEKTVAFSLDEYSYITHGYAATIHKAQGVTVDKTYVVADKYLDRHATYVAATRHRVDLEIHYDLKTFRDIYGLYSIASREKVKDMVLDYAEVRDLQSMLASYKQEERTRTVKLDRSLTVALEEYLDKQIQFDAEQKIGLFNSGDNAKDQKLAKEHKQKVAHLSKEVSRCAQKIMENSQMQGWSKKTGESASIRKKGGFKQLKEKLQKNELSYDDCVCLGKNITAAAIARSKERALEKRHARELEMEQDEGVSY